MKKKFLEGTVKRHPDGFGFFIPTDIEHPDVYIPRQSMNGVMTNDKVMIEVFAERGSTRFRGEVMKILTRGTKQVIGEFRVLNETTGLIRDEGKGWGEDFKIEIDTELTAEAGQLVAAEILSYPGDPKGFRGKIKEIIGDALDPLTDIKRVLLKNDIPHIFPADVLREAETFEDHVTEEDMRGRQDLRDLPFITIDGATAKDFDDAIYVEQNDQGFKLWVAIADVSHYVRVDSLIDREAYIRGTSVYFPNFVVPMLPEELSNGLCSLMPNVPRLSLVAEIQMDFTGEVLGSSFYEAVIQSKSRVTYGEAQEVIDGNEMDKHKHVKAEILRASDLAKILMAKRFRDGSLDLEIPEVELLIDETGIPYDLVRSERLFAHRLIEEMMLAANVAVAKAFMDAEADAIYRIHEPPNVDALEILERYMKNFGSKVSLDQGKLQKRLTKALQDFAGKPEAHILNILTLRSMSQAKYSPNNLGHFGLGFENYTHFTSPIRRYPDLIVHRLLKKLSMPKSHYKMMTLDDLTTAGTMLSACEQRSVKAERQFQAIKKARFMEKHVGEEFDGMISSVTKFGVFVLLRQFEVDGLIRLENLSKEKMEFDEENLVLIGARSGLRISIGDQVKIRVASADPEAGQIDFEIVREGAEKEAFEKSGPPRLEGLGRRNNKSNDKRGGRGSKESDRGARNSERGSQRNSNRSSRDSNRGPKKESSPSGAKPRRFDQRKETPKAPQKNFRPNPAREAAPKSRKAVALDKMEEKVFEFLSEANKEHGGDGKGFDPEAHLQQAMAKWKARNGNAFAKPERRDDRAGRRSTDSDRGSRDSSQGAKKESGGKPQKSFRRDDGKGKRK